MTIFDANIATAGANTDFLGTAAGIAAATKFKTRPHTDVRATSPFGSADFAIEKTLGVAISIVAAGKTFCAGALHLSVKG